MIIATETLKNYSEQLAKDMHWLTMYAQDKPECQELINITVTMSRAAWALEVEARRRLDDEK